MKLGWRDLKHRITGVSAPFGGVQWQPPVDQRELSRALITFLENRRVLFVESEAEVPDHAVRSVIEIRTFLTDQITRSPEGCQAERSARQMRASCLAFLRGIHRTPELVGFGASPGHWASWVFQQSLGMFRSQIGLQIAILASSYEIDVEPHLAAIMPPDVEALESESPRFWV